MSKSRFEPPSRTSRSLKALVTRLTEVRNTVFHVGDTGTYKSSALDVLTSDFAADGGTVVVLGGRNDRERYGLYKDATVSGLLPENWSNDYLHRKRLQAVGGFLIVEDLDEKARKSLVIHDWLLNQINKPRFGLLATAHELTGNIYQVVKKFRSYVFHPLSNRTNLQKLLGSKAAKMRIEERIMGLDDEECFIVDSQRNLMSPENIRIGFTDDLTLQDLTPYLEAVVYGGDPETWIPYKQTAKTTEPREKRRSPVMNKSLDVFVKRWDWENEEPGATMKEMGGEIGKSRGSFCSAINTAKEKGLLPRKNVRHELANEDIRKLVEKLEIDLDQNQ